MKTDDDRAVELAQLDRLSFLSGLEATTLVLLVGVAVPLKHWGRWSLGVRIMGPAHGLAFVAFLWTALQTVAGDTTGWSRADSARLMVSACIPFGGFFNLPLLMRRRAELSAKEGTR